MIILGKDSILIESWSRNFIFLEYTDIGLPPK